VSTSQTETRPGPWIEALRGSHERLRALVSPLPDEQISADSYDTEWTIAQVLSHLGSGAEIFGLFLATARDGSEPPSREAFGSIWDRWNAKSPREQADDALASNERFVSTIEGLDAAQLADLRFNLMGRETDVTGMAAMRLSEHAVHTWDVEVALDPTAGVAPVPVTLLVDGLEQTVGYAGKPSGLYANIRVTTTEPVREFALTIGDAVTLTPWTGDEPTGQLDLPAEALIRLVAGRLDAEHTPPLTVAGVDLADLRKVFPGY
jgi:uncharacterized protein (TIGR03083 family)